MTQTTPKSLLGLWLRAHVPRPYTAFAKKVNVKYARLIGYMRGEEPPAPELAAISAGLNMSTDDVLIAAGLIPGEGRTVVPVLGRTAALEADKMAPEVPLDDRASVVIAGMLVTIIVQPLNRTIPKG